MRQELISWATIILSFFAFLSFPPPAFAADVVINEILPNPKGGSPENGEFIELYSSDSVDISGWILDDIEGGSNSYTVPQGTVIAGYKVFYKTETKIGFNNDKDTARLIKAGETTPHDSYSYEKLTSSDEGISFGRVPDGTGNIVALSSVSPGQANVPAPTPTFTPAPTQTQPSPTKAPTSTPTNKPAATAKVTQTPTATSIPTIKTSFSPTPEPEIENNAPTSILGEMVTASPSALPTIAETKGASFFDLPKLFIGAGFVFLAGSGILAFRRLKNEK